MNYPDKIEFEVTESDIILGTPQCSSSCAVSLAVKRKYPDFLVTSCPQYVRFRPPTNPMDNGVKYRVKSTALEDFIYKYDSRQKVQPFSEVAVREELNE